MGEAIKEYTAVVWRKGEATPAHHLTIRAHDIADAKRLLMGQFGDQIVCSVWSDDDAVKLRARIAEANDQSREYHAIVWTKDPEMPGRRMTVQAQSIDHAKMLVKEEFGEEADFCYVWNEHDRNRPR